MDHPLLIGILASLAAAGILGAFAPVREKVRLLWRRFRQLTSGTPRSTIRIVPILGGYQWQVLTHSQTGEKRAMLSGRWYVTNIIGNPVFILNAYIARPRVEGAVSIEGPEDENVGAAPIQPGCTSQLDAHFTLPADKHPADRDHKLTVIFVDQFSNEYRVPRVVFTARQPPRRSEPVPVLTRESIYAIKDPLERKVATLLQAEVHRRRSAGISHKHLGSIQISLTQPNELIAAEGSALESDVVDHLELLHSTLDPEEQLKFRNALLGRLNLESEYRAVAYIILFGLFRTGGLLDALSTARQTLAGDRTQVFGDFLRALDLIVCVHGVGLHSEVLDELERFLEVEDARALKTKERLAMIRALQLARDQFKD